MRALSAGKQGFSTLELVIALALLSLVMGGVILASWSSSYWAVASETSNEALYKAKTTLEDMRASAKENFFAVSSAAAVKDSDPSCADGGLCYYLQSAVLDLSSCAKYAEAIVSWQVVGYPTTTTSLFTNLTNPSEVLAQGSDCLLAQPKGQWNGLTTSASYTLAGTPRDIDVLSGTSYIAIGQSPYLSIAKGSGIVALTNGFALEDPANAIDVARNAGSGRTYAYLAVASTSNQFQVIDVTEPATPFLVASVPLSVDPHGSYPQGWRVAYYAGRVYVATRETTGPELHIFDVSLPENPLYLGSKELNTSAYGLIVRQEGSGSGAHTLAYLATTRGKELMVLDASDPAAVSELPGAASDLPGDADGRSIALSGNGIYIGRASNSGNDLYVLDASDIFSATAGLSTAMPAIDIGSDVTSLRVSGQFLFVGSSKSGKQLQLFSKDGSALSPRSSISVPGLGSASFDVEGDSIYALSSGSPQLRIFESN
ncbi:hypothetical protein H7X87_02070 [Acetobacteraceae bacterium]|nr:hypothetical protein [Candidatus Parcubacteria bacterium]